MALLGIPAGAAQAAAMPQEPFQWGSGGRRMTPEDIARQREMAAAQMQQGADFSPVGHWTQGLARASQGILGGLGARQADKASEANMAESQSIAQMLIGGEGAPAQDAVLQALVNPNVSKEVRGLAELQWKRMNPDPGKPTEFMRYLIDSGVQPGSPEWQEKMRLKVSNTLDPFTNIVLGGNTISGRQSDVQRAIQGGGGPASGGGPQPGMVEDGYVFRGGNPSDRANWEPVGISNTPAPQLGDNGMPSTLNRQQYMAVVNAKGKEATDAWIARNNIKVGN